MTLSLHATMKAALGRQSARLFYYAEITDGTSTWKIASGNALDFATVGAQLVLSNIESVSVAVDPLTREVTVGSIEMVCEDCPWLRLIVSSYRLKSQQVTVYIGEPSVSVANFAPFFAGLIEDVIPNNEGSISIHCENAFAIARDNEISGEFVNLHPYEAMQEILERSGTDSSLIDTSSLAASAYSASTSHWVVGAGGTANQSYKTIRQPTRAFDLVNEVARLVDGSLVPQENGQVSFTQFSTSASAVAHWTEAEYADLRQESNFENMINQVSVAFERSTDQTLIQEFRQDDTASQGNFAYPGTSDRIIADSIETRWLENRAALYSDVVLGGNDIADTDTPPFTIMVDGLLMNWCGFRVPAAWPASSQAADAQLSSSRPCYVKIFDGGSPSANYEIMKLTAATLNAAAYMFSRESTNKKPRLAEVTVAARALFGTTAKGWLVNAPWKTWLVDVTIPVAYCAEKIRRFSNGCPILKLRTGLSQYHVQVGDLVTLDAPRFLSYGLDGVDDDIKWEITSKEVSVLGDSPGISWTLAFAYRGTPPSTTIVFNVDNFQPWEAGDGVLSAEISLDEFTRARIQGGFTTTDGGGLTIGITNGRVSLGTYGVFAPGKESITVEASKDIWIAVDAIAGTFVFYVLDIGDPRPNFTNREVPIAKVVTGASSITSITELNDTETAMTVGRIGAAAFASDFAVSADLVPNWSLQE